MDDNAYLDTIKDINWDTFYQQKMALERSAPCRKS